MIFMSIAVFQYKCTYLLEARFTDEIDTAHQYAQPHKPADV